MGNHTKNENMILLIALINLFTFSFSQMIGCPQLANYSSVVCNNTLACSPICVDSVRTLNEQFSFGTCTDEWASRTVAYEIECGQEISEASRPCNSADDELACRTELVACVGGSDGVLTTVCPCYNDFLECLDSRSCDVERLGAACRLSDCTKAQCNGAELPGLIEMCRNVCQDNCPDGVISCSCPPGASSPSEFKCKTSPPQVTPEPEPNGICKDIDNEWIRENCNLFIGLCVGGGLIYCCIYCGLLVCIWKCLPSADREQDSVYGDLDYYE